MYYRFIIGTKLTYPGEGDEAGMRLASDVIFVIKEKPHTYYRREGNNLVYDINITLPEALEHKSLSASVPLIEGGVHRLRTTPEIVFITFFSFATPNEPSKLITEHVVPGRGMPISKVPGTRGDLVIKINILLPQKALSAEQLARVKALLA